MLNLEKVLFIFIIIKLFKLIFFFKGIESVGSLFFISSLCSAIAFVFVAILMKPNKQKQRKINPNLILSNIIFKNI